MSLIPVYRSRPSALHTARAGVGAAFCGALALTGALVSALAIGLYVGTRRFLLAELRARADRLEIERDQQATIASAAERSRIAREMHDVLAHRISLLALHAGALEIRPDLPPDNVRETAGLLRATARQALDSRDPRW